MKKRNTITLGVVLYLAIATINFAFGQQKYLDRNGLIIFEASEKLFEEVKATNKSVTAIFNEETNEIASLALMKGFRFKNSLMQEHFNENYIESDTYPKATFKGSLIDFNPKTDLSEKSTDVTVKGTLALHGKEKEIETTLKVSKVNNIISMTGSFIVTPADFDINIPKIVRNKIAKEVTVSIDFKLEKK